MKIYEKNFYKNFFKIFRNGWKNKKTKAIQEQKIKFQLLNLSLMWKFLRRFAVHRKWISRKIHFRWTSIWLNLIFVLTPNILYFCWSKNPVVVSNESTSTDFHFYFFVKIILATWITYTQEGEFFFSFFSICAVLFFLFFVFVGDIFLVALFFLKSKNIY